MDGTERTRWQARDEALELTLQSRDYGSICPSPSRTEE